MTRGTAQQRDARATKANKEKQKEAKIRKEKPKNEEQEKEIGTYASLHVARFLFLAQTGSIGQFS